MAASSSSSLTNIDLTGPTYCVVTGASQGIGRALAVAISEIIGPSSVMLLLARNQKELEATAELCESENVRAVYKSIDLGTASIAQMNEVLKFALGGRKIEDFATTIIFHNVGSLGNLSVETSSMENVKEFREYYDLNVFNVVTFNTQFLKLVKGLEDRAIVVNVTSLCAIKPMAGMAYYCSGKAAREMYFKVLAEEMRQLKVLNYSPGPVETSMIDYVLEEAVNLTLKEVFESFKTQGILLKPEVTARKCMRVLQQGKFASGDHVDYFDDE